MCACKDPDFCPDASENTTATAPELVVGAEPKSPLHRRTFLKAAALGTAAVGGLKLGSLAGLAHTDDKSPCTAGDIELTGGQITNLPCDCSATSAFQAVAVFQVTNNNNANRLNITLHLGSGGLLGGQDFVLRTGSDGLSGSCSIGGLGTTQTMYANLGTLPCDVPTQCYPGSVIAFQTANNQGDTENCAVPLTKYPGGQCRRQEICIIGFDADLTCSTEGCGGSPSDSCAVACGGTLFLQASASGGTFGSNGTYTFVVTDPDGLEAGSSGAGASSPHCFTINNPKTGTYTLQAFDSNGCVRSDTTSVTVEAIPAPDLVAGTADCDGAVTFTVTNCDPSLTYTYTSATGSTSDGGLGVCSAIFQFPQDGAEHTVTVTASNGNPACDQTDSASVTINTPVTVTIGAPQSGCSGDVTVTAAASGGSGSGYTFQWSIDGVAQGSVTGDTLFLLPQLDGACREVTVTATDSLGCVSASDSVSFSQCVVTTIC